METMTTIVAYEKTASGAHKITFMPDVVAGTFDDEIGLLAQRLAGEDKPNPVQVALERADGKLHIKGMREITPPVELGGVEEEPAAPAAPAESPGDAVALTLDAEITKVLSGDLSSVSSDDLIAELAERLGRLDGLDK